MTRAVAVVAAVAALLGGALGCAPLIGGGVLAGGTGIAYTQGTVEEMYIARVDQVWTASQNALMQLRFVLIRGDERDALGGRLTARRGDWTPVAVSVKQVEPERVAVSVRVGVIGIDNKDVAQQIVDQIDRNLGLSPRTPPGKTNGQGPQTEGGQTERR